MVLLIHFIQWKTLKILKITYLVSTTSSHLVDKKQSLHHNITKYTSYWSLCNPLGNTIFRTSNNWYILKDKKAVSVIRLLISTRFFRQSHRSWSCPLKWPWPLEFAHDIQWGADQRSLQHTVISVQAHCQLGNMQFDSPVPWPKGL